MQRGHKTESVNLLLGIKPQCHVSEETKNQAGCPNGSKARASVALSVAWRGSPGGSSRNQKWIHSE